MSSDGCRPFYEVTNNLDDEILYTNKNQIYLKHYSAEIDKGMTIEF